MLLFYYWLFVWYVYNNYRKICQTKNNKTMKERVMKICLYVVGFISALLFDFNPVAAITIAAVGSTIITLIVILQVVGYKEWHPSKPSTFWCASVTGTALAFLLLLALMKLSIIPKAFAEIGMMAIAPSITPIIGVLIANIIRVCKKEKAVFIV